jgi:putative ABC transport system ATP-binding protein
MNDAIRIGNRLIMMFDGRIILDVRGEEKQKLTVDMLHQKFREMAGEEFSDDRAVLI